HCHEAQVLIGQMPFQQSLHRLPHCSRGCRIAEPGVHAERFAVSHVLTKLRPQLDKLSNQFVGESDIGLWSRLAACLRGPLVAPVIEFKDQMHSDIMDFERAIAFTRHRLNDQPNLQLLPELLAYRVREPGRAWIEADRSNIPGAPRSNGWRQLNSPVCAGDTT